MGKGFDQRYRVKIILLVSALVLIVFGGCGDDLEQPPEIEVFSGELEVLELNGVDTDTDQVVFTVEGSDYRLEHTTHQTRLCESIGTINNFGGNLITLTRIFTIPSHGCDTLHVPQGLFKAAFRSDSLILGPDTLGFGPNHASDSMVFTFRLVK
jgi:hypothetical protein